MATARVPRYQQTQQSVQKIGWFRWMIRSALIAGILANVGILTVIGISLFMAAPPIPSGASTTFYGADHSVIGEHHQGERRYAIALEEMSPAIVDAIIAIEDRDFYQHHGFDIPRIISAILANIEARGKVQGASTITQQYARNLYLTHEKTWSRKIEEAFYALRLEAHYDKEDILEGYLNTIYFGHGAYGIEAASRLYFDKSASELNIAEASFLAGIPKGPSHYSPFNHYDRAKERQKIVLHAMEETGVITTTERMEAEEASLSIASPGQLEENRTGLFFQDYVEHLVEEEIPDIDASMLQQGGLHIYTTLDPELQEKAEKWVEREIPSHSELEAALVAMDPTTGDVRALVGGKDYEKSTWNRAIHTARPPGSLLKPFLYYAALEDGFTPLTAFRSEPTTFEIGDNGEVYAPGNYGDLYANDFITMSEALAVSDNIFAVKTHLFLGPNTLVDIAEKAGVSENFSPLPSLALGAENVRVLDIARGYSTIANGGSRVTPRFITKITNEEGEVLYESEPTKEKVFDEAKTYVLIDMMTGMFDTSMNSYTSVTGRPIAHFINRPLAGKSGSTSFDSWMAGFSPQLTTAVWIGYDDNRPINHREEGQISKKIWAQFMNDALRDELKMAFSPPDSVIKVEIDEETGLLASEECGPSRTIAFEKGTEPTASCTELLEESMDAEEREEEIAQKEEKFLDRLRRWFPF
ncbi:transglycosylase domain-containing protein [Aliibacillus thermotolerans]|uniref:Transglycosylase domain-containing protein n=1 Tax=Aliibacillus thermotolerans TaxID=1834418 RepID=A0ABW0U9U6_9BACI|nr:PBP1A family penicillin-binding protein [Aliibacillus thermotolerans]MDA3130006.1 PBP1A family penicillin-binding protein [Aliibacillus thermotolerans]